MSNSYKKPPHEMEQKADRLEQGKELTPRIPANRAAAALQLRIDGAGYGDIAKVLEFATPAEARRAVERALASEESSPESVDRIRELESRRIERILVSLMKRATSPKDPDHLQYARTALAAIKQQTELYGAQMPTKVDITYNPSTQQLEKWVGQIVEAQHKDVVEGEIIDVEIVEDEPSNTLEEF